MLDRFRIFSIEIGQRKRGWYACIQKINLSLIMRFRSYNTAGRKGYKKVRSHGVNRGVMEKRSQEAVGYYAAH